MRNFEKKVGVQFEFYVIKLFFHLYVRYGWSNGWTEWAIFFRIFRFFFQNSIFRIPIYKIYLFVEKGRGSPLTPNSEQV